MGSFYGNVLVGRACEEVLPLLREQGITGYVLPVGPGRTGVYPAPDTTSVDLAAPLSELLGAPTVGTYVFDSDVLVMLVCVDGEVRLHYDSCPGYFGEPETDEDGNPLPGDDAWPQPLGADPEPFLPLAVGRVDRTVLESALRGVPLDPEDGDDGRYVFANAQHFDVMAALGLNASRLTTGHTYLSYGDLPYETTPGDLISLRGARG